MKKWLKIKFFRISSLIFPYLRTRWFCKTGYHFSTTNLCRLFLMFISNSFRSNFGGVTFGIASIGREYSFRKNAPNFCLLRGSQTFYQTGIHASIFFSQNDFISSALLVISSLYSTEHNPRLPHDFISRCP